MPPRTYGCTQPHTGVIQLRTKPQDTDTAGDGREGRPGISEPYSDATKDSGVLTPHRRTT
jgi:hypothetical protein